MAVGRSLADWIRLPAIVTTALALSWTATMAVAEKSAGDYFVHSLPGAPEGQLVKMHAGHVEVTPEHNGNMFFWHFQNKHIANKQRTVIWLNGGPGCSSEDGAMMEIGPYRAKDENTLVYNEGAWNEFANVLFVDNPVGTGFSYVDTNAYVRELDEMAKQFVTFLEKWFRLFPEYEHDDIYIAGESYAGQYIPYIAKEILARNKEANVEYKWKLEGLLIGNGWISPPEQYEAYLSFAYEKGIVKKGTEIAGQLENQLRICKTQLAIGPALVDNTDCEKVLQDLLRLTATKKNGEQRCVNMYDVRLTDTYPSCGMNWPPDLDAVTPYLRRKEVTDALHINANKVTGWVECNGQVGASFKPSNKPSVELLPDLLKELRIVLFSGSEDLICNHLGTEALISNMNWNNGRGFELTPGTWAPRRDWTFENEAAGFWQEARNLTYVVFYNSSHMVPFDYPRRTRDMLDRFMGVDISSIGGKPADSRLDGEKVPETTVGGVAGNGTDQQNAEKAKLDTARWEAYRKSGEIVLVIVAILAASWGYYVWRDRRKTRGYQGLAGGDNSSPEGRLGVSQRGRGLDNFRNKRNARDVEAQDFDESELDDLHLRTPMDAGLYSVGAATETDDEDDQDTENEKGKHREKQGAAGASGSS